MQGVHRPSAHHSLQDIHADIETPSWRRYVPHFDTNNDPEVADDDEDTTAEAYINKHHDLALEERRRWAGTAPTNPPTPNGTLRPRASSLSSKRVVPLFPTPAEAFKIVRSALNNFRDANHNDCNRKPAAPQRSHLLEALQTTLTCFADVEEKLRSAKMHLKAAVNADAYHVGGPPAYDHDSEKRRRSENSVFHSFTLNGDIHRQYSGGFSPNLNEPTSRLSRSGARPRSQSPTPPLPMKKSSMLTKDAVAMITKHAQSKADLIEEVFRLETSAMREDITRLARQADIRLPESPSFQKISTAMKRTLRSQESANEEDSDDVTRGYRKGNSSFEKMIRRAIDADKYPLLAQSFTLDAGYCLDGTRRSLESIARNMKVEKEREDEDERKPWEGLSFLEAETKDEARRDERNTFKDESNTRVLELDEGQGPTESIGANGFAIDSPEFRKVSSFENDNDLMLTPSVFQATRLDARRKLRQNVKRKLPRIHKERRNRKAYRFRDAAESISSQSSGASSASPQWNGFRDDAAETIAMERKPSVTVKFQPVVNLDDKEDGTDPSVVYLG